jgi:hypothetical protein
MPQSSGLEQQILLSEPGASPSGCGVEAQVTPFVVQSVRAQEVNGTREWSTVDNGEHCTRRCEQNSKTCFVGKKRTMDAHDAPQGSVATLGCKISAHTEKQKTPA